MLVANVLGEENSLATSFCNEIWIIMRGALMIKKFLIIIANLMIFISSCYAMTFSQPVEIGRAFFVTMGIFEVEGANYHTGIPFSNQDYVKMYNLSENGITVFDKGIARFGNGDDAIYFHYDARNGYESYQKNPVISKYGDKRIENTVSSLNSPPGSIRMIKSDGGITLYLLSSYSEMSKSMGYYWMHTLLGKQKDGRFVKYFDTVEFSKRYFSNNSIKNINFADCIVRGDTIILKFKHLDNILSDESKATSGEFRFKWNDQAQWFSVEQVVY